MSVATGINSSRMPALASRKLTRALSFNTWMRRWVTLSMAATMRKARAKAPHSSTA